MNNFLGNKKKTALLLSCFCAVYMNGTALASGLAEFELDPIVVTATKTELESKKIPQAVEVMTEKNIADLGANSVKDALRMMSGLNLAEVGMAGNKVQIRGMDTRHALILIDGKRMAGEDAGNTTNVYELNRIDINTVARIEVVRGPSSAMYGSDALGGVINIITKKSDVPTSNISMGTSSVSKDTSFRFDSGKQGKMRFVVGGQLSEIRNQHKDDAQSTNIHGPRRSLNLELDYDLGKQRGLVLDVNFLKEQFKEYYDDVPRVSKDQKEWFDNTRSAYSLMYYGKDSKNDYKVRTYYNTLKKESRKVNYTAGYKGWADFDHMSYDNYVVEASNAMKINDKHRLSYGADYRSIGAKSTRLGAGGDNIYMDNFMGMSKVGSEKRISTYGAYLQDEWKISDKLFLLPSVRYDHHSSFGSNLTPRLGATYELSDNLRVKANYGKGYRAPSIFQLYSEMKRYMGRMQVEVYGNSDLQPERTTSFDIGLEWDKGADWGKISYFNNSVTDLIEGKTTGIIPGGGLKPTIIKSQYFNISKAQINGIEAELGHKFNQHFSLKGVYNYLDATNSMTGERLSDRAEHSVSLQLNYTDNKKYPLSIALWNKMDINYRYEWSVGRKNVYKDYTYNTWNIMINKQFNKNTSAYMGLDNMFDKKYKGTDAEPFEIMGRVWRMGVNIKF